VEGLRGNSNGWEKKRQKRGKGRTWSEWWWQRQWMRVEEEEEEEEDEVVVVVSAR
jgi:hypothetical protein